MKRQAWLATSVLLISTANLITLVQAQAVEGTARNIKAQDFMNTFGVNVHFDQNNYRNVQAIADALNIIGFSRVRSDCHNAKQVAAWKDLAAKTARYFPQGLKANVLITGYLNAPDVTIARQQALLPQIASFTETIEGPNEINNYYVGEGTHGPDDLTDRTKQFASNYEAWAKALYTLRENTPALANVKLLAPNIASGLPEEYAALPNVSPYVDAGNMHYYAGNGRQPSGFGGGNFSSIYDWYKAAATPDKPVASTEWGQTTASKPGQAGCDNATQAKYILNQMCDFSARGVYRAYLYQLMDGTSNGDPTGNDGAESHFGIFDYQWHVKPAAQALSNIKNLLADTTTNFKVRVPAYSVDGVRNAGAAGSHFSISKSDGSTFIVVWNEPQIWDQAKNADVAPPDDFVTVNFGGDYNYRVFDPLIGLDDVAHGQGSNVRVNVVGSPLLIQVSPAPH